MNLLGLAVTLSEANIVVAAKDQVSSNLAGEVVILNVKSGVYYGLEAVGARVWELLQQPRRVSEIGQVLLEEYEVEPVRCQQDLLTLLRKFLAEGLIEVRDETAT